MNIQREDFTKYEIARILGARALQIAMDAPLLLKISDEELKAIKYDSLKIAEREFSQGLLPISVKRPMPKKKEEKLEVIKDDKVDDEKIVEKEKEIEEEIAGKPEEMGLVEDNEKEEDVEEAPVEEA